MLEVEDAILTHDIKDRCQKELLYQIMPKVRNVIGFTFSSGSFMLPASEVVNKPSFGKFNLGRIFGSLKRRDLCDDR